jgi:hypothetical protein
LSACETHHFIIECRLMGFAEFIIGPADGRTRWLNPSYEAGTASAILQQTLKTANIRSRWGASVPPV